MARKKICFVVTTPASAESFLKDHMTALKKDYDVYLACNKSLSDTWSELDIIDCYDFPIQRQISIRSDLKALFALKKILKKGKFDAVHSVTPKAGLICAMASWLCGIKHRTHIFTGQVWATRQGAMRMILKGMDWLTAHLDNHILVDGEGQRQYIIKNGIVSAEKSKVLCYGSICGVKLERFNISEEVRKREREKFGFKEEDVVFVFMGRLNHDKGIGELYTSFNKLVSECPNAKLVLYGRDEEDYDKTVVNYKKLKRNENFFYPGYTSAPFDSLQEGDVFVLPTWREGFGSSVIEAQALGLPVITSDAYGVVDASVEGETGLRCKVDDPEGLYECMKTYYNDAALRKAHGEAGRKRVFEKFDCNVVTKAWVDYYKELLG